MTLYTFAIGGTGARCLESLIYLCAMGMGPAKLHPIIVDPDSGNGNGNRTIKLINTYKDIRSRLPHKSQPGSLFYTEIDFQLTDKQTDNKQVIPNIFNPNSCLNGDSVNLAEYLNYNTMPVDSEERRLVDLLFSQDELSMDMKCGYRGIPSIGSVLMTSVEESSSWAALITDLGSNNENRVFIFASVFGGTGASGYPVISRLLRNNAKSSTLGGALLLPYFKLPDPVNLFTERPDLKNEKILPRSNSFLMNTKVACDFYAKQFEDVNNANYILGDDFEHCKEYEDYQIGDDKQLNSAHVLELQAALAAVDFTNKTEHRKFYKLEVKNSMSKTNKMSIEKDDLPYCVDNIKNRTVLWYMERLALLYNYVRDIDSLIEANRDGLLDKIAWLRQIGLRGSDVINERDEFKSLHKFLCSYKDWISETHSNTADLMVLDKDLNLDNLVVSKPNVYSREKISRYDTHVSANKCKDRQPLASLIHAWSQDKVVKGGM